MIGPRASRSKPLSHQSVHHKSLEVQESTTICDGETSSSSSDNETDLMIGSSPEDLNEKKRCNAHEEYKLLGRPGRQQKVESRWLELVNESEEAAAVRIPPYERSAPSETVHMTDVFTLASARRMEQ